LAYTGETIASASRFEGHLRGYDQSGIRKIQKKHRTVFMEVTEGVLTSDQEFASGFWIISHWSAGVSWRFCWVPARLSKLSRVAAYPSDKAILTAISA